MSVQPPPVPTRSAPAAAPAAPRPVPLSRLRLAGAALIVGPLAWGLGVAIEGKIAEDEIGPIDMVTGIPYLAALMALCWAVLATRATGDRKGRAFPIVPLPMLPLAMVVNLSSLPYETYDDLPTWNLFLDPFWPLSQLAMVASAIAVAKVGRWRGPLRWLPLAGALWLPIGLVAQAAGDAAALGLVLPVWFGLTYGLLGLSLLVKPQDALGRAA